MKSKSFIVALLTVSTLGLTTSCADMFDIDSTRVVYEKDHNLDSTADSVYTTLGVLQGMRQIADRYVILGEVRGDLCEINENTKTSLRNLANFNFGIDNEYLDVKDYYAIINNCNYALAKIDTLLTINNKPVMTDEYVAMLGIRAWTYLQLAINYRDAVDNKLPYYTEPITDMAGLEAVAEKKATVKEIAEDLIPQLVPYFDYELPYFGVDVPQNVYPILRLVAAELSLWAGDYENAVKFYEEYLMKNKKFTTEVGSGEDRAYFNGFVSLAGSASVWDGQISKPGRSPFSEVYSTKGNGAGGYENLAYITLESNIANGIVSELPQLFSSFDNTHYLYPSTAWKELSENQTIFNAKEDKDGNVTSFKSSSLAGGDMRKELYYIQGTYDGEDYSTYSKHRNGQFIVFHRRAITYLRYAEAMSALASELNKVWESSACTDTLAFETSRKYAKNAFYMLKDAYQVFFPEGSKLREDNKRFEKELQKKFIGVHARGTGPVYLDKDAKYSDGKITYDGVYVLEPSAIANRFGIADASVEFNDTIRYIDELIIDELALESTLEGNRFGDLVRFAERHNDVDILAKRVAGRKGQESFDQELYDKLTDKTNWYLPLK